MPFGYTLPPPPGLPSGKSWTPAPTTKTVVGTNSPINGQYVRPRGWDFTTNSIPQWYTATQNNANAYGAQSKAQQDRNASQRQYDLTYATQSNTLNNEALRLQQANSNSGNSATRIRNELARAQGVNDAALLRQQKGFAGEQKVLDEAAINAAWGFNDQSFGLAKDKLAFAKDVNTQSAMSDAASRGAIMAQGTQDNFANIETQYSQGMTGAGIDYSATQANLTHQRGSNDVNYRGNIAQFDTALANNSLADAALKKLAGSYGVSSRNMNLALANALERNNLDAANTIEQINRAYDSKDATLINQTTQMIDQILQNPRGTAVAK